MKKIQYSIYKRETGNAGGKAKNDAFDIAKSLGFYSSYNPSNSRFFRIIQQFFSMPKFMGRKIIFFQFPAVKSSFVNMFNFYAKEAVKIALVHDIPSLQGVEYDKRIEIKQLNYFDCLITHNDVMTKYIIEMGYKGVCVPIYLFDYLHDTDKNVLSKEFKNSICFAGNLDKSSFCYELQNIHSCFFNLYGVSDKKKLEDKTNINYKGFLSSEEIVYRLDGDYGLVWDGNNLTTCDGKFGNYLRFNNPHKLSLYIASGKPVIVWKESAVANFVKENNIGIVVDSLYDLQNIDLSCNYNQMKDNVFKIKHKVANGDYLKDALARSYKVLGINE